jgi:hypothetical protein
MEFRNSENQREVFSWDTKKAHHQQTILTVRRLNKGETGLFFFLAWCNQYPSQECSTLVFKILPQVTYLAVMTSLGGKGQGSDSRDT